MDVLREQVPARGLRNGITMPLHKPPPEWTNPARGGGVSRIVKPQQAIGDKRTEPSPPRVARAPPVGTRPGAPTSKKTPRTSRGAQISSQSLAGFGLLAAGSRSRGHGLLRVMMLLGVMLLGVGLVLGLHRRVGLGRSSILL